METVDKTSTILSPAMLWKNFSADLPLKESKVSQVTLQNIVYNHVYFYGRDTEGGRVRIYGVYARNKDVGKRSRKAGLLIIPDIGETVELSVVDLYVKQGYSVLMIDYGGESDAENYTKYPDCVSYANFKKAGRAIDFCDETARETAWFEWVAVAAYGVSFLKNQDELDKIGVIGIKNGANIGWQLCGNDRRVDCFVPLFGCGWRTYKGIYKYSDEEIEMDDEKLRYLAGVDAHAYAQYVNCPVFYMTASNSREFDCDRAMDTVTRVPEDYPIAVNVVPRLSEVLDKNCKRNVDIFLAKHLFGYKVTIPKIPKINVTIKDKLVSIGVDMEITEQTKPKKVNVYFAEDSENPAFREWVDLRPRIGKDQDKIFFEKTVIARCSFVSAFAVVEYKNGITVSSLIVTKKNNFSDPKKQNLIYSSADRLSTFSVADPYKSAVGGVFFEDEEPIEYVEGSKKISGVCSRYGLVSYRFNVRTLDINENSMLVFDVNCPEYALLKVTVTAEDDGEIKDYSCDIPIKGADIWQKILIKCSDFKSEKRISIKDYSVVNSIRFESVSKCIFNNILLI